LGLEVDYDLTPALIEKVVYAGTQATSFEQASAFLNKLADCSISAQRVHRLATRIGEERHAQCAAQTAAFEALSLPERQQSPTGHAPQVVCAESDGGRIQLFDRDAPAGTYDDGHWRETKVGVLHTMASEVHAQDPCPQLPETFCDPERVGQLAREIKGIAAASPVGKETAVDREEPDKRTRGKRVGQPEPLAKSVVATCGNIDAFASRFAAAAYARGFMAAERKAFVADGLETNWSVWRRFFSHFTPILDFVHALMYVYAAAMAGRLAPEGWAIYRRWAQWVWSGEVARVIEELHARQRELGLLEESDGEGSPRRQVQESLRYLTNQQSRMKYDEYRRNGLPITSSYVESTIKQINRRMKGTEKFWNEGAEPLLTLVADHLSDTPDLARYWQTRHHRQQGLRQHQTAA
jgi:hypothetical protein